jgi:flagellar biosynthesis protein FlhA
MDGASKFVKGDAVAGIIITAINIIGGFIIGAFQQNLPLEEAASIYTILTIGDGLVSQIPALIISTAAGILVSRSSSEEKMGAEFAKHIFSKPTPVYIGSGIIFAMGLVPGLPSIPFMLLGAGLAGSIYLIKGAETEKEIVPSKTKEEEEQATSGPEDVEHLLALDTMELEVGYGLIPLVDRGQDGTLLSRIKAIRRQFASEMGIIIPPIHIRDNLKLKPSEYRMLIKGVDMSGGELMTNHLLAMDPGDASHKIEGIPTTEPAFNLPALWIPMDREEDAKFAGYTVVDNSTIVATHITEIIRNNAYDLLGRQEVQHLLDNLSRNTPKAVEELIPNLMTLGMLQKVLQNLLKERISIRDLLTIVETLADYAPSSKDTDLLTEYVRQKISRSFITPFLQPDGTLPVITIDHELENLIGSGLQQSEQGAYLSLDPRIAELIINAISREVEKVMGLNLQPIILCSPAIRRHLRRMVEQYLPSLMIISHAEIAQNISVKATGKVEINNAG